jgi:hypothetical protein
MENSKVVRMSSDIESATLQGNINLEYKRLYEEIRKAKIENNPEKEKELREQLLDYMVDVGDAK